MRELKKIKNLRKIPIPPSAESGFFLFVSKFEITTAMVYDENIKLSKIYERNSERC